MKTPLLLISGWAHAPASLAPLATALTAKFDVTTLAPADLAAEPAAWSGALADRIAAMPSPPVVAGWSLGGMVALAALMRSPPPAVRGLALISSTSRFCAAPDHPCGTPERNLRALALAVRRDPAAAVEGFLRDCAHPAEPDVSELRKTAAAAAANPAALRHGLDYLRDTDLRAGLGGIACPVLLLHGEADRVISPDASAALHAALPGSRMRLISGAGHDLPIREAAVVARELLSWMATS